MHILMWILLVWGLLGVLVLFTADKLVFQQLWPPTYRAWETALLAVGAFAVLFAFNLSGLVGLARYLGVRSVFEGDGAAVAWLAAFGLTTFIMVLNARRMDTLERLRGIEADRSGKKFIDEYLGGPSKLHLPQTEAECIKKLASLKPTEKELESPYFPDVTVRREALGIVRRELEEQVERLRDAEKSRKHHAEMTRRREEEAREKAAWKTSEERRERRRGWVVLNGTKHICGCCLMDVYNLDLGSPGVQEDPTVTTTASGPRGKSFACDDCGKTETWSVL